MQYQKGKLTNIRVLDGLRGVAILLVIIGHIELIHKYILGLKSFNIGFIDQKLLQLMELGWVGVDLFFVISGFLITRILLIKKGSKSLLKNFYIRRILRIFPLYYLSLFIYFFLLPLTKFREISSSKYSIYDANQIYLWTYTVNFLREKGAYVQGELMHFWSLAVEEQFYLIIPIFILYLGRNQLKSLFLFGIFISIIFRIINIYILKEESINLYVHTLSRIEPIFWGGLLATLMEEMNVPEISTWRSRGRFILTAVLSIIVGILFFEGQFQGETPFNYTYSGYFNLMQSLGFTCISVFFSSLLFLLVTSSSNNFLNNSILTTLGKYSYFIYITNTLIISGLILLGFDFLKISNFLGGIPVISVLIFITSTTIISIALGFLSFNLFEKHFLKLKDRFHY